MARKFNVGRQGEQLLNQEWHDLFMSLKYLNYKRYEDIHEMKQERQTEIPDHALRTRYDKGDDLLQVYYPGTNEWKNVFEGYYHPANTERPEDGSPIAPYQLCIDPKDGFAIKYWNPTTLSWEVAQAQHYTGNLDNFNGMNFQFISPLKPCPTNETSYPVPYIPYGKLFSNSQYESNFVGTNQCDVTPPAGKDNFSWVHVNAKKLARIDKRLIQIQKDRTKPDYGFVGITSTQTEFYAFKSNNRLGELLRRDIDFKDIKNGIQLMGKVLEDADYKYIYSISYIFDESPCNEGSLIHNKVSIHGKNEVFIGAQIAESISVFMDGLSLERTDEEDNDIYIHHREEGTIEFTDDDDAEIINEMQMSTLLFPKRTGDFTISNKGANVTSTADTVTVEVGQDISSYETPMVFCSGLGLQETEIFEDVIIEGNKVTIKNLVLPGDEIIKGYVADVGKSFVAKGVLNTPVIEHSSIEDDKQYAVFVNGILLTPTNRDITVEDGKINIHNAEDVEFDNLDYVVFEIDSASEDKIALVFDDTVSYYSIRIDDGGQATVYNDCNSAIVYINDSSLDQAGIVLDQAAVEKPINAIEGYYKGGQIIRSVDSDGNYEYYKYDYTEQIEQKLDEESTNEIDFMVGYYATTGSIHLLGDNQFWTGDELSYYAYNYANMVDEAMITGSSNDLAIPIGNGEVEYRGSAKRLEAWKINCAALSTYVNGLMIENEEVDSVEGVTRKYSIKYPMLNMIQNSYYGERNLSRALNDLYNKYISEIDILAEAKIIEYNAQYKEEIEKGEVKPLSEEKAKEQARREIIEEVDISKWILNEEPAENYFTTPTLRREALQLAIYINEDMKKERATYIIEKIERDEFVSAYRDYIYLELPYGRIHPQIYRMAQDTIEADFLLVPGINNIYLNGVLLDYSEYCKFDNNKIMFNVDVCGLQQLPKAEKMMQCLPQELSFEERSEYEIALQKKQVLRLIEGSPYYIPTTSRDTILVEKRNDLSIKTVTYDVQFNSYGTLAFTEDYYDMPESLFKTADLIKIYINGVYYDGGYILTNRGGIKGIQLNDSSALVRDPLYEYLLRNPNEAEEFIYTYNKKYECAIDKITFEWR